MAISKLILNGEVQMDVTSDTVTAGSMLSGTTATKNDGTKATGNIASKSSTDLTVSGATVTAPAGYYANAASKAVATTTHPNPSASITSSTGVVTASHTQSTGYVTGGTTTGTLNLTTQAGKTVTPTETAQTAVASYRWTTGPVSVAAISSTYVGTGVTTRSAADMTVAAQSVTAPAGYYSQAFTKAVTTTTHPNPTATIVSSTGVVTATHTQTAGYVAAGTTTGTLNLTTQGAQTITPGSTEQTIASNRWLTGTQTIEAIPSAYRIVDSEYYKATLVNDGNLGVYYTYVIYSDTQYASTGSTFYFKAGDIITCKADNLAASTVYSDGSIIYTTAAKLTYSYTTPAHPLNVLFSGRGIHFNSPTLEITSDGIHDVADYARATVAAGSAFPPAVTITKAPTIGVNTSGVVTASYTGSSSITPTVTSGYISQGTAGTISTTGTSTYQLTSKAAATYYPSTADQTIASQRWLVGNQTIKSVTTSNLTAANIAEGVTVQVGDASNASRITQITGTHSGATSYTATVHGSGNSTWCYVMINNSAKIYAAGLYTFKAGDILTIYTLANSVWINGEQVTLSNNTYTYTLPIGDITIDLSYTSNSNNSIKIWTAVYPSGDLNISAAGTHNVYKYSQATVAVPDPSYYSVYKSIAFAEYLHNEIPSFPEFIRTLSRVEPGMFYARAFASDSYYFSTASYIGSHAFASYFTTTASYSNLHFYFPSVTMVSSGAFYNNYTITDISIPACTVIYDNAFREATNLRSIYGPVCTNISYSAFSGCSRLTTASFPECSEIKWNGFFSCSNLTTISFPKLSFVSASVFAFCRRLTAASLPSCSIVYDYGFQACYSLSTISFPKCERIGIYGFASCSMLSSIYFPLVSSISNYGFANCSSLTTANFPQCETISQNAFNSCWNLTSVSFPKVQIIGTSAFANCSVISTFSFPACTLISTYAFRNCWNLLSLYLLGSSVASLSSTTAFTSTPISTYTTSTGGVYGSIFVPASLYNSYLTATNWSFYSKRIVSV